MTFTQHILELIEAYDLGAVIEWILKTNTSQALPYHGFNHSLWVMLNAAMIYAKEKGTDAIPRSLLLAALFHDYAHAGGKASDDVNVERAAQGCRDYASIAPIREFTDCGRAACLVYTTEFPLKEMTSDDKLLAMTDTINDLFECESEFLLQAQCLRDADMAQNANDTLLANQVGIKAELFKEADWRTYAQDTIKFLRGIKYETDFAKHTIQGSLNDYIIYLEKFQKLVFPSSGRIG